MEDSWDEDVSIELNKVYKDEARNQYKVIGGDVDANFVQLKCLEDEHIIWLGSSQDFKRYFNQMKIGFLYGYAGDDESEESDDENRERNK
jgi:hypothetical protein